MGMKRETYERRFRQLFAEVVNLVDEEIREWRERLIEVRKDQVSPEKLIYTVEWRGQPLNAFVLELRKISGYPCIFLYYDHRKEEIYQLHRKPEKKVVAFHNLRSLLQCFIEDTIIAEAKRVALREGFFAAIKGGDLIVPIGNYEFRFSYFKSNNLWRVRCDDIGSSWDYYECMGLHPLEFFPSLLKAIVLQYLL